MDLSTSSIIYIISLENLESLEASVIVWQGVAGRFNTVDAFPKVANFDGCNELIDGQIFNEVIEFFFWK